MTKENITRTSLQGPTLILEHFAHASAVWPLAPLCPGGKERMHRLMAVIASGRIELKPLVTHRFMLAEMEC
jgi:threonine dehydrogenase-like Zn-dependent dehydrogenase